MWYLLIQLTMHSKVISINSIVSTPSDHKIGVTDVCSSSVDSVIAANMLNFLHYYHYSKDNDNHLQTNEDSSYSL